ncbi:damage-inducible protein DinB [Pseudolysobacter antarcticus]|uniref:Damage-inducible protein DinB n=2 Tax=Pseudolysobacter antarcticus TaxID=2511995 RepID=A0A411HQI8_9GAMM|nr:damage-inducible protein DinB [Pseudolysobacter antarcticus]
MLVRYKAWANELIFSMVSDLPYEEAVRQRRTRFGNMVHTLNHVYVIDSVFQAHLQAREHGYISRNTPDHPPLADLWRAVQALDQWYIEFVDRLSNDDLDQPIQFEFIGGGNGVMTRSEMIMHVVNHGTYHRGFVGDMMYQAGVTPAATDLPVFLRDVPQSF